MGRMRRDEIRYFEPDFVVQPQGIVQLMVRSPEEAVLSVWRHDAAAVRGQAKLEGTHVLHLARPGLDSVWEPELFEGEPDWWLLGGGRVPATRPSAGEHPLLTEARTAAMDVLAGHEKRILEIGAARLRKEAGAVRARMSDLRPDLAVAPGWNDHALRLAERYLCPEDIARIIPGHEAFGFGGTLETQYGPVTVHIETGPVVRIQTLPLVPLIVVDSDGPIELRLDARRGQGGWDNIKPTGSGEIVARVAEEIYEQIERTWPDQMRSAFVAWAGTSLALNGMIQEMIERKTAVYEHAVRALEVRAQAAEERLQPTALPRP